jgi:hypothetical protein
MAVRVGLHHRLDEDPGPDNASDERKIRSERIEVELEPGRPRQRR